MSTGFLDESLKALGRLAAYMQTLTSGEEFARYNGRYAALLRLQAEAVHGPDETRAAAEAAFRREYASCNPALALTPEQERDVAAAADGEGGGAPPPPTPTKEQCDEIKKVVHAWCQIDNEEREMKARIQAMRKICVEKAKLKTQLSESIMLFMERFGVEDFEVKNGLGILRFNKRDVKKAATKGDIVARLKEYLESNEEFSERLIEAVLRPGTVTRRSLRRLLPP